MAVRKKPVVYISPLVKQSLLRYLTYYGHSLTKKQYSLVRETLRTGRLNTFTTKIIKKEMKEIQKELPKSKKTAKPKKVKRVKVKRVRRKPIKPKKHRPVKKKKVKRKISKPKKVRVHKNVVRKKRKHVSIQPRHSVRHIVRRVLQTMPVKHLITPSFMPESIPLVSKPIAVSKTSEPVSLLDEEPNELIALRLVKLYFEDIARLGFKRNLELDSLIDAYFYILQRLKNKDKELQAMANRVKEQETKMALESKEELFPTLEKE